MTEHIMGLYTEPFESIRSGSKTVEVRLNDEKRRRINPGDVIKFIRLPDEWETLKVDVLELTVFSSFQEMYETIPAEEFNATGRTISEMVQRTYRFYTPEQEQAWGTVAIKIKLRH